MDREDLIAAVIEVAGGELTGRVRLQKTIYLLERLGLGGDFDFGYHHYGPFSSDVFSATEDAKAFGMVSENLGRRALDDARFSIFQQGSVTIPGNPLQKIGREKAAALVALMQKRSSTVLELAATVDWLHHFEDIADWQSEVVRRKGQKTGKGRLEEAVELLTELGLPAPASH
jgi:uncharacterized protein YwgA